MLTENQTKQIENDEWAAWPHIINAMARKVYLENKAKGFWDSKRNIGELLMLVTSELAEALEADRKDLNDDKLTHRKGLEVELADAVIRIFDMAAGLDMDLGGALVEKLAYNRSRPHKHGKAY